MLRELKTFRRNSGKNPTTDGNNENIPVDRTVSSTSQLEADPSRPPFNTIQEPTRNPKSELDQETHFRRKNEKTPSKGHTKGADQFFQLRTPEKLAAGKGRLGWVPKGEQPVLSSPEIREDPFHQGQFQLPPPPPLTASHALSIGNGYCAATPRSITTGGKASSVHSGTSSTQSTPTKSVTKPMFNGVSNTRAPQYGGSARAMNILVTSKGIPLSSAPPPVFASAEVPHFELKEDPSFWMDHNVQVVIRVRPINSMERSLHGYSRCIKQESAQSITWIGQSETRFMFDYVACETVNQEMLFRAAGLPMVENCMSGYNSCVFAYGQTGSGKTHTMLGEINDLEIRPSANRGMTPRIFEFLFARIKAEEESRRDDKLQYTCKCSFLEIYNEQITDLLNPSSTNLLIREDPKKGVHVENLTEFEVENVYDILKLLIQGAANRKVATTNMNRESSRSHSVFTCTIESRWQTDSAWTFRFARLNLVDLAGSERQKTSGAEGDRLKEASNINKSLSTLGHVIMVLADLANGRQRHVPYRDSRLTFLLQDSLGGNSKTMIIANVSPSICSANETLSTLKFAQRAKIIQNNAVVNENASGDVFALQHQIHLLKEELSMLKQQNISRSLSFRMRTIENAEYDAYSPQKMPEVVPDFNGMHDNEELRGVRVSNKQMKSLEATLAGAFRREKMADVAKKQLEAEIEQLNRLVRQREEDTQCSKMMIKFREDKIYRMEALLNELIPSDSYLREENNALSEEIKLLRSKVDINPEVTRFATENIRLLRQLREFQDFYEEGERDLLLTEISELRNQLGQFLDGKFAQEQHSKSNFNAQDLCLASPKEVPCSCNSKHAEEVLYLQLELEIQKTIIEERESSCIKAEERANLVETELSRAKEKLLQISKKYDVTADELNNASSFIEALESQQILSINEHEELRENNNQFVDALKKQEQQISTMRNQLALRVDEKLKRVQASLEKAWNLNMRYQSDQASHTSNEREMYEVRRQVEAETAEVIVCLQEELATLNQLVDECTKNELLTKQRLMDLENERKEQDDKLYCLTLENTRLAKLAEEKEQNTRSIIGHWEQLAFEISDLLENGNAQLDYATYEVDSISDIYSNKSWISEQFGKVIRGISKRDSLIEELQKNLEDACNVRHDMELKLRSLRGATLAITEAQQQQKCDKECRNFHLTSLLSEKTSIIFELEDKVKDTEEKVRKVEICAAIFFITANRLYEINKVHLQALDEANLKLTESEKFSLQKNAFIQEHTSLLSIEGEGCQDLRAQLEQNYQLDNSLDGQQDVYLGTNWKNEEGTIIAPGTFGGLVETKMKLKEFHMKMSTLKSCMHEYTKKGSNPTKANSLVKHSLDDSYFNYENQFNIGSIHDAHIDEQKTAESIQYMNENYVSKKLNQSHRQLPEDIHEREKTIEILRKEIESALQSLTDVQSQMAEMFDEKEEITKSMLLSHDSTKSLTAEVHRLNLELLNKEKEFEFKLLQLEDKLRRVEENAMAFNCFSRKEKQAAIKYNNSFARISKKENETSDFSAKLYSFEQKIMDLQFIEETMLERSNAVGNELDALRDEVNDANKENALRAAAVQEQLIKNNEEVNKRLEDLSLLLNEVQVTNKTLRDELDMESIEKARVTERLGMELFNRNILLDQKRHLLEDLQKDISRIAHEKDEFESEAYTLKEKLKLVAEENAAAVKEAPQRKLLMENEQLKLQVEHMTRMLQEVETLNQNLHDELEDKMNSYEILQKEMFDLNSLLSKRSHIFQEFQKEMTVIKNSKEQLESQVSILKERLEMAESLAEVKAVATEARQIAEERKSYAQVKEEEVLLLEKSVEELECTVNALQEEVKIVKEEAKRQRLQRNELEMEEDSGCDTVIRHLKDKLTELNDAQYNIQQLQKEVAEKELEIVHCKSIISELNLHAEAQASEYKRKFKELEAMAFQVKSELVTPNTASLVSTKSEKGAGESRGSGSPFKCTGLGIAQQINRFNTEKDEELTVARCKIEELEALAASRQKQIFMLNIRLAATESMTHDVLRDLLGIKLDMAKYAKMNERSPSNDLAKEKEDKEWAKLKKQVDEFVEERQSLLEDINHRHKELIAAQIRVEKLQERDEFLSTENELLKVDNAKYKNIFIELEEELGYHSNNLRHAKG